MSNFLAISTVTAALQLLLGDAVSAAVPGSKVRTDRADAKPTTDVVNVYLYRTSADQSRRNEELPARREDGSLVRRPRVAVDLHYLLTFHGKDEDLVPQRLLGAALARLHSRPVITHDLLQEVLDAATDLPPTHPYLAAGDLIDAEDPVRVTADELSLDELSKLWSVFFQSPYQLSATYTVSAVLLEETVGDLLPAPPVLRPQLTVRGLLKPTVVRAVDADDPRAAVVATSVLQIIGSGLRGDETSVRLGPHQLDPADGDVTATSIRVSLTGAPAAELRPGLHPVTVVHRWLVGDPAEPRGGEVSNAVGVFVAPTITAAVTGSQLEVTSDLQIGSRQHASVSLLEPATGAVVRVIEGDPRAELGQVVRASLAGVPAGQYGVALLVDGAQSPVIRDADSTITSPVVTVP